MGVIRSELIGRGGCQVVSLIIFYSDDPSLNPANVSKFCCVKFA